MTTKQKYTTPAIIVHGNVSQLTAASADSDRQDRIFNASGHLEGASTGSLDQCFFHPNDPTCVINE